MAQSGVLSRANIDTVLRSLAQRRHNGALEINLGDRSLEVVFFQGKIVDLFERNHPRPWLLFRQICRVKGWEVPPDESLPVQYSGLGDVATQLGGTLDTAEIREHLRKLVSDEFYLLDPGQGAFYSVRFEMPEFDRDAAAQATVSGLLLDIAERDEVEKELRRLWPAGANLQAPAVGQVGDAAVLASELVNPMERAELEARSKLPLAVVRRVSLKFIQLGCLTQGPAGQVLSPQDAQEPSQAVSEFPPPASGPTEEASESGSPLSPLEEEPLEEVRTVTPPPETFFPSSPEALKIPDWYLLFWLVSALVAPFAGFLL